MQDFIIVQLSWHDMIFYVSITENSLNEHMLTVLHNNKSSTKFVRQMLQQNILIQVIKYLKQIYTGISVTKINKNIDMSQLIPYTSNYKVDNEQYEINLWCNIADYNHLIPLFITNQLALPQIDAEVDFNLYFNYDNTKIKQVRLATNGYIKNAIDMNEYLPFILLINSKHEVIYIPKIFFSYYYSVYFPQSVPFISNEFFIDIVLNSLNIELCKTFNYTVLLKKNIKPATMHKKNITKFVQLQISHNDFKCELYTDSKLILTSLQKLYKNTQQADAIFDNAQKITHSVVSHYIEIPIAKLNQLKCGDILVAPQPFIADKIFIDLGSSSLISTMNDNQLTITGKLIE